MVGQRGGRLEGRRVGRPELLLHLPLPLWIVFRDLLMLHPAYRFAGPLLPQVLLRVVFLGLRYRQMPRRACSLIGCFQLLRE